MRRRVLDPGEIHTSPPSHSEEIYYILFGYEGDRHLLADNLNDYTYFELEGTQYLYNSNSDRYYVRTNISYSPITMDDLYSGRPNIDISGLFHESIDLEIDRPSDMGETWEYGNLSVYSVNSSSGHDIFIYDLDTQTRERIYERTIGSYSFTWYLGKPILYLRLT